MTHPRRGRRRALAAVVAMALTACTEDEGSAGELCQAVAEKDMAATFQGFDPTDPERALEQLRTARVALGDLLDVAPAEVREDIRVEIDYVQALIDALEDVPAGDATESALRVQSVTDAHSGVGEASANLAAFAEEAC